MSDFCPVYDWDYSKMQGIVHYNCIPLIYWLPYFVAGLAVGVLPFIIYLWRNRANAGFEMIQTLGIGIGFFLGGIGILARDIVLQILAGNFVGNQTISAIAQFGVAYALLGIILLGHGMLTSDDPILDGKSEP
jgi:hypothetical protein